MELDELKDNFQKEREKWEEEERDKDERIYQLEAEVIRLKDRFTSWRG